MNIENNQIDEKTPESNAGDKKSGNKLKIWLRVISVALLLAACITAFFKFEMYNYIPFLNRFTSDEKSEAYTFATDVKSLYEKTLNLSSVEIKSRDPMSGCMIPNSILLKSGSSTPLSSAWRWLRTNTAESADFRR